MEIFTKDMELSKKENLIKDLIKSNDKRYLDAINLIFNYFRFDFLRGKSNYFLVFKAIYIDNVILPNWELANHCHVCKTSLYDYRNEIIDLFFLCLNDNITMEKITLKKD